MARLAAVGVFLGVALAGAAPARAKLLTLYSLPASLNYAAEIVSGPDGALWFTQDELAPPRQLVIERMTTAGLVSSTALPPGIRPTSLAIGPDGAVWYASRSTSTDATLGRISPEGLQEIPLAGFTWATAVATGPDRALWFAAENRIRRVAANGSVVTYAAPGAEGLGVEHMVPGPGDALWFATGLAIGRIDRSGRVRLFGLPARLFHPGLETPLDIVAGPDGALWFSLSGCECIGRMTPAGAVRVFRLPHAGNRARALTVGTDGAIWFTDAIGVGRITMTGEVTEFRLRQPGNRFRFAEHLTIGPDAAVWFTLEDSDVDSGKVVASGIGRIDVTGANAPRLLVARLADEHLRGRAGASIPVRFSATRPAGGWLSIMHQRIGNRGWRVITRARVRPGTWTVRLGLPRRAGTYRALLRLNVPSQVAGDSALIRVSR